MLGWSFCVKVEGGYAKLPPIWESDRATAEREALVVAQAANLRIGASLVILEAHQGENCGADKRF